MSWNRWVRQIHRWVSIAFTVGVLVNSIAVARKAYTGAIGLLALLPLAVLLFTGLYLFMLPHVSRWASGRRTSAAAAHGDGERAVALPVGTP